MAGARDGDKQDRKLQLVGSREFEKGRDTVHVTAELAPQREKRNG